MSDNWNWTLSKLKREDWDFRPGRFPVVARRLTGNCAGESGGLISEMPTVKSGVKLWYLRSIESRIRREMRKP